MYLCLFLFFFLITPSLSLHIFELRVNFGVNKAFPNKDRTIFFFAAMVLSTCFSPGAWPGSAWNKAVNTQPLPWKECERGPLLTSTRNSEWTQECWSLVAALFYAEQNLCFGFSFPSHHVSLSSCYSLRKSASAYISSTGSIDENQRPAQSHRSPFSMTVGGSSVCAETADLLRQK